jgi:hypothetical protein
MNMQFSLQDWSAWTVDMTNRLLLWRYGPSTAAPVIGTRVAQLFPRFSIGESQRGLHYATGDLGEWRDGVRIMA